ncbi:translation initiation factor IF-2-like isoform X1 [Canis lupus familiaris]|uniref:translation initiation factor IF-2-like isoform X1 n=1 Tax=Canis lupus familiaris TaxID=9615 RepID=UPI0006B3C868|nr:translation initiation factor IF-2-like isoform X1 [Canis lupus familiaris]XP_022280552.1 translation initiation factor IF-2-like isoform X1 [Canis lupus familiaris]XP_022280553.1 translation initiation factor IF-2-like isoform X1 [Canis lupus familiaris]XP_022280554.1 translation initiation factor IF-2-like isoform X1 [Canis lupus familiaris]XP_022280555.1 translation initiation factor IF-2-like isoform X1 [Canis lupus familiaris]XP_038407441.1 translation initiation factor IF-2-like isofo|eukprot:XP_022280551.1 uncharacterized protein LOC102156952 isoform X1 [Canis lupus familiaris]
MPLDGGERGGAAASEARRCQRLLRERGFGCLNTCAQGAAGAEEAAACSALREPSPTRRDLPAQGILGLVVSERMEADTWRTRRGGSAPGGPAGLGRRQARSGRRGPGREPCGRLRRGHARPAEPPGPQPPSCRGPARGGEAQPAVFAPGLRATKGVCAGQAGPGVHADLLLDAYFTLTPPE